MNWYTAYGVTFESAFEFPELPAVSQPSTGTAVTVECGPVEPVPESVPGEGGRRIQATGDVCRLSYEGIGSFRVAGGEEIVFDPADESILTTKVFRRLIQNEMMGILCHQRGLLVLHASAVSVDGKAAVFLGPRGAGKSTTAAAFHVFGHTLLEDDVVGIRFDDRGPVVVPGVPQLRLRPDAAEALDVADGPAPKTDVGPEKRYERVEAVTDPVALAGCYYLTAGDELALEEIRPREQLFELIAKTYVSGLLEDTDTTTDNFEQCSTVLETIPLRTLTRPKTHDILPDLIEFVAADLRSSSC